MAENGVNAVHVNESIIGSVDGRQTLEELTEVFRVPEFIDLVELPYNEIFILENIGGYQSFKNEIETDQEKEHISIGNVGIDGLLRVHEELQIVG